MTGDVLFFLNDREPAWPYHSMILLEENPELRDPLERRVVYHTGPRGTSPGIVKILRLSDLAIHPNNRWHPVESNPYYLGVYRWKILAENPQR